MWYASSMTHIEDADAFIGNLWRVPGVEVYRVGGSVRDELMGRTPKDADYIVRGAHMEALADYLAGLALGRGKTGFSPLRLRNGTQIGWRVHARGIGILEVVLPRSEENAGPGREQKIAVNPMLSLAEDAKRRDFTFNALYKAVGPDYPARAIEGGVADPTGCGLHDVQRRIVRTTHSDSFRDDPLRILRALRFVSTLDADLAAETRREMTHWHMAVDGWIRGGVSGTVLDQLSKLLMGQAPAKALRIARDTGVIAVTLPELAPMLGFDQGSRYHDLTTDEHTFKALAVAAHVDAPLRVRLALLFHDAGKPESAWRGDDGRLHYYAKQATQEIGFLMGTPPQTEDHEVVSARLWDEAAKRLNVDRKLRNDVRTIILNHMVPTKTKHVGTRVRRMRVQLGDDLLRDLFLHRACDLSGKEGRVATNHIQHIHRLEQCRAEAQAAGVPASVKDLEIDGHDAQYYAGCSGRSIGEVLGLVLDEVVCDPAGTKLTRQWQIYRMIAHARRLGMMPPPDDD
jgi:tRNA nucleotidyltransferase (CCA-adding enzyme)